MSFPQKVRGFSSKKALTNKEAWRRYVADRWVRGTQDEVRAEWGLTEWEARSVVYGEISQATETKIKTHRNGGALLALDLLLVQFGITCHELADQLEQEADRARDLRTAEEIAKRSMARRLAPDRQPAEAEVAPFAPSKRGEG